MIVNSEIPNIERSEEFKETKFGIRSQADLVHIFSVLRSKMYSDKILAVLREYSTNAFDAHVLAGKRAMPIEVDLPTALSPTLHIRDFGPGMSEDDIRETYCMYGASTKRQSNDFNGQLGFGSKAAFSYTDSYTITSFQGGRKAVYEAFIDESQLGAVSLLLETQTTEQDGIKISIPVKRADIQTFDSKAKSFYQHFEVKPDFPGRPGFVPDLPIEFSGNGWAITQDHRNASKDTVCVMGNVAYPLNIDLVIENLSWEDRNLHSKNMIIIFNIGDLSIAASREALEYDAKTKNSIRSKIECIKQEVQSVIELKFKDITSIIDFKKKFRDNRSIISSFDIKLKFKGVTPVGDDHISLLTHDVASGGAVYSKRMVDKSNTNLGIRISTKSVGSYVSCDSTFVECNTSVKVERRLATLFEKTKCSRAYLFTFANAADRQLFLTHSNLNDSELLKLSSFDPKELPKVAVGKSIAINSLLYKYVPKGRPGVSYSAHSKSIFWDALTALPTDPLFVALDRFYIMKDPNKENEANLINSPDLGGLIALVEKNVGFSFSDRIVGIKIKNYKDIAASNPQYLTNFLIQELTKKLDSLKPTLVQEDAFEAIRMASARRDLQEILLLKMPIKTKDDQDVFDIVANANSNVKTSSSVNNQIREIERLLTNLGANMDSLTTTFTKHKQDLETRVSKFFDRHPLLKYLDLGYHPKDTATKLAEDIQLYLNR